MLVNKWRIETAKDLLFDINSVVSGHRKEDRLALANVYEMVLAAESFLPSKPPSLLSKTASDLRRKVDATCPLCLSPDRMKKIVNKAKNVLSEYRASLIKWLKENEVEFDENGNPKRKSVHDLKPNI